MKHFQLYESNKSTIPIVECIFLSAAMPSLVYIVLWASQTLKKILHATIQNHSKQCLNLKDFPPVDLYATGK